MSDGSIDKQPAINAKVSHEGPDLTTSITVDDNGNTYITGEDGEVFTIGQKAERALVWKIDLHVLPLLTLMYLCNALDKSNMGNAATVSMPGARCAVERLLMTNRLAS